MCPFFPGGTVEARGRGDELVPLADIAPLAVTIAVPQDRPLQKTMHMYRRLRADHYTSGEHTQRLVDKLAVGGAVSDDDVFNVFEDVLSESMPLAALLREGRESDRACPHLAGSGPAFFFLSPLDAKTERRLRSRRVLIETTTVGSRESTGPGRAIATYEEVFAGVCSSLSLDNAAALRPLVLKSNDIAFIQRVAPGMP
jgi:4-diphosphocytidyl-2C-methyl-D-erythritol kinase